MTSKLNDIIDKAVNETIEKVRPEMEHAIREEIIQRLSEEDAPVSRSIVRRPRRLKASPIERLSNRKPMGRAHLGTGPRLVMRQLMATQTGMTGAEIISGAKTPEERGLSKSTIYNTLVRYTDKGLLKKDQSNDTYQLTETGKAQAAEILAG